MEKLRSRRRHGADLSRVHCGFRRGAGNCFHDLSVAKLVVLVKNASNGQVPWIASALLSVSDFLKAWWWAILALMALLVRRGELLLPERRAAQMVASGVLSMPLYGPLLRTRFEVQFLETLGNLLTNALPLNRALSLVKNTTTNLFLRERLGAVESFVADGGSLTGVWKKQARPARWSWTWCASASKPANWPWPCARPRSASTPS